MTCLLAVRDTPTNAHKVSQHLAGVFTSSTSQLPSGLNQSPVLLWSLVESQITLDNTRHHVAYFK